MVKPGADQAGPRFRLPQRSVNEKGPIVLIDHPRDLDLRGLLLSPAVDGGRDRLVVTKLGLEMARAEGFRHDVIRLAGMDFEEISFEVRLSEFLRPIVGRLLSFYAPFWHARVAIKTRVDAEGCFGVTAAVTPVAAPERRELLNARVERHGDGGYTFTLTDPRWRGQAVTLHPRRGALTVSGVLHPGHKLSGRYALSRRG